MKLIKTGIAGLDEFLKGGLPPRVILLLGVPGSGNELFAQQVAYTNAKQNPVTYFTVNKTRGFLKDDMISNGWNITESEENGRWKYIKLKKTGDLSSIVVNEIKQHRSVVVDSLSELLLTRKIEEVVDLITAMVHANMGNQEFHLVLLTQGMQDQKIQTAMEHLAEGVITFNTDWEAESTSRNLLIRKMRGTLISARKLPYTIGKRGFVIETATRIT
jgi:KaiC/GvpD/RAD55 family RecA-like ATPase